MTLFWGKCMNIVKYQFEFHQHVCKNNDQKLLNQDSRSNRT